MLVRNSCSLPWQEIPCANHHGAKWFEIETGYSASEAVSPIKDGAVLEHLRAAYDNRSPTSVSKLCSSIPLIREFNMIASELSDDRNDCRDNDCGDDPREDSINEFGVAHCVLCSGGEETPSPFGRRTGCQS